MSTKKLIPLAQACKYTKVLASELLQIYSINPSLVEGAAVDMEIAA